MGFLLNDPQAPPIAPDQVGMVAAGVPPIGAPSPASAAANVIHQYIADHGSLLRQRLLAGHALGGFAPPKYEIPDLVSQIRGIPGRTADPAWSNQGALAARFQGFLRSLPHVVAAAPHLRSEHAPAPAPLPYLGRH